jgi:hypothetical protein
MLFPHKDEVLAIHAKLIERFGGSPGIRDEGLLESALLSAPNRLHYEHADLATCAATYAFHLTRNHLLSMETSASGPQSRKSLYGSMARDSRPPTMKSWSFY